MTITLNRNWVNTLVVSLPDYADELGKHIQSAMTDNALTELDRHVCALAAALADNNGELAFEIAMSNELRGNDIREDIAKAVIALTADLANATDNATLYALATSYVLKNDRQSHLLVEKLSEAGYTSDQLRAVHRIASLIPAIRKCLI